MILISKYLVPKGYAGITIFPFVFLKHESCKTNINLVNHEKIHLRQQLELLIIVFYFWYVMEFLIWLCVYKKWNVAYQSISFEKEAYAKEKDLNYLKSRPFWNFINYIKL
ncbi:MAG: hypothetical protein GYB35_04760 [Algicola sp.]|nr:hypothetical protein [Algicola sp.]